MKPSLPAQTGRDRLVAVQGSDYYWRMKTFGEVLESADGLSLEEQENLITILQHRLREQRRAELAKAVQEARREFQGGRCRPAMPEAILLEAVGSHDEVY